MKEDGSWFAALAQPVPMKNCDNDSADLLRDNDLHLRSLDLQTPCSVFPVHLYQELYTDLHESARWTIHYQNVEQCLDATAEILAAGSRCVYSPFALALSESASVAMQCNLVTEHLDTQSQLQATCMLFGFFRDI